VLPVVGRHKTQLLKTKRKSFERTRGHVFTDKQGRLEAMKKKKRKNPHKTNIKKIAEKDKNTKHKQEKKTKYNQAKRRENREHDDIGDTTLCHGS